MLHGWNRYPILRVGVVLCGIVYKISTVKTLKTIEYRLGESDFLFPLKDHFRNAPINDCLKFLGRVFPIFLCAPIRSEMSAVESFFNETLIVERIENPFVFGVLVIVCVREESSALVEEIKADAEFIEIGFSSVADRCTDSAEDFVQNLCVSFHIADFLWKKLKALRATHTQFMILPPRR